MSLVKPDHIQFGRSERGTSKRQLLRAGATSYWSAEFPHRASHQETGTESLRQVEGVQ